MGVAAPTHPGQAANPNPAPSPSLESVRAAFAQLEVIELIGQGGMGAVFKARQPKLNRFVALKILSERLSHEPAFAERFAREAQMLARLHHPNIVTVHDFGQANGFFYLLMEFVEGVNLRQAMAAARFTPEQALAIVPMICDALQYAHDEGVLHRDIKPENILLDTKGRVRLVDFGIAKLAAAASPAINTNTEPLADAALTQSGSALGTPQYMAPEQQLSPETVDSRADIYSLGVVFYELLTGELPTGRFARPSQKTPVDPRLDDVVLRAMAQRKEQRFATAQAVRSTLEAIAASPSPAEIPAGAAGHPMRLSSALAGMLLGSFVLLVGILVRQLSLSGVVFSSLWSRSVADPLQASVLVIGLAALGWLAVWLFKHEAWFLAPLRDRRLWIAPQDRSAAGAGSRIAEWLRIACLSFTAVFALEVALMLLSQVHMLMQVAASQAGPVGFPKILGLCLAFESPVVGIALAVVLVRREVRRREMAPASDAPAWFPRAALFFVLYALVTCAPVPRGDTPTFTVAFGALSTIGAIAILTRSRIWRALSIALLTQLLLADAAGLVYVGYLAESGRLPVEWSQHLGPLHAASVVMIEASLSLFCYVIGLIALQVPSARAAFGLPTRTASPSP